MLSVLATSLILAGTLVLFFITVMIPYGWSVKRLLNGADDEFVSARGSRSWFTIGSSLYAGAVGTWCLTVPVEIAVSGGMWAVIGYAIGCGLVWTVFIFTGPVLRNLMQNRAFTCVEFVRDRYGRTMHVVFLLSALMYLMIIFMSELIAMGSLATAMSPDFPKLGATLAIAATTAVYSALGGFPATLVTDKIQAVLCVLLLVVCYGAVFGHVRNEIPSDILSASFTWPAEGLMTGACLIVSCLVAEQMNQGTWQRVFAAKDVKNLRLGFSFGMLLMFPSMIIFGLAGMFAVAGRDAGLISMGPEDATQGLFLLLATLPNVFLGLVLCMAIGLVTSTADYVQTSIVAIIAGFLPAKQQSLNWARIAGFLLNIPVVLIASFNPPQILTLLMFGNVISAAIFPAVFLGFSRFPTWIGALSAVITGIFLVWVVGWFRTASFTDGLQWFMFPNGYNWECLLTFIVVVSGSTAACFLGSWIHTRFYPEAKEQQLAILEDIKKKNQEAATMLEYKDPSTATNGTPDKAIDASPEKV